MPWIIAVDCESRSTRFADLSSARRELRLVDGGEYEWAFVHRLRAPTWCGSTSRAHSKKPGHVVRRSPHGIALEWDEFLPLPIRALVNANQKEELPMKISNDYGGCSTGGCRRFRSHRDRRLACPLALVTELPSASWWRHWSTSAQGSRRAYRLACRRAHRASQSTRLRRGRWAVCAQSAHAPAMSVICIDLDCFKHVNDRGACRG